MRDPLASLSPTQRDLLGGWFPRLRVAHDHSWGLINNHVLEIESGGERYIVKAGGPSNHHIGREIDAHERWLAPWASAGRAPRLVACDRGARILVAEYLPGELVMTSDAREDPETFRQAGELLRALHAQAGQRDETYEERENAKVLRNLDGTHRLSPEVTGLVRDLIGSWPTDPVDVVPTHGDWQPRNWLVHESRVSVIDLGRAGLRPAATDWLRLTARDFRTNPRLEAAFVEGYGGDPRGGTAWFRERLREAVNTAAWAHAVGDETFEAEGHAMLERVLAEADTRGVSTSYRRRHR